MKLSLTLVIFVLLVALAVSPQATNVSMAKDTQNKPYSYPRTVLIESFLSADCSYCFQMAEVMNQLRANYSTSELTIIEYHGKTSDPLYNSDSSMRKSYYYSIFVPHIFVDGSVAGTLMEYDTLNKSVSENLTAPSEFTLSVNGNVGAGNVDIVIQETGKYSGSKVTLQVMLLESDLWVGPMLPENPKGRFYNYTCRDVLPSSVISLPLSPGGITLNKAFTIDTSWNVSNMSVVALLQDDSSKEVLQSAWGGNGSTVSESIWPVFVCATTVIFMALVFNVYRKPVASTRRKKVPPE